MYYMNQKLIWNICISICHHIISGKKNEKNMRKIFSDSEWEISLENDLATNQAHQIVVIWSERSNSAIKTKTYAVIEVIREMEEDQRFTSFVHVSFMFKHCGKINFDQVPGIKLSLCVLSSDSRYIY